MESHHLDTVSSGEHSPQTAMRAALHERAQLTIAAAILTDLSRNDNGSRQQGTQSGSATSAAGLALDRTMSEYLADTESELTDLSTLDEIEMDDRELNRETLTDSHSALVPFHLARRPAVVPPSLHRPVDMRSEAHVSPNPASEVSSSEDEARPKKRVKANVQNRETATSATAASPCDGENTQTLTTDQQITVSSSSSLPIQESVSKSATTDKNLPPLLSPTLPPSLDAYVATRQEHPFPEPPTYPPSLKMTILPKGEAEMLRSHNAILRSHNVSLATQNAFLRQDGVHVAQAKEELKAAGPLNHDNCVLRSDYDTVEAENQFIRTELDRLRTTSAFVMECNFEWARRENMWDTERQLFQNEIQGLLENVNGAAAREQELTNRVAELEAALNNANTMIQHAVLRGNQEKARADALQAQVQNGFGGIGGNGGFYPPL